MLLNLFIFKLITVSAAQTLNLCNSLQSEVLKSVHIFDQIRKNSSAGFSFGLPAITATFHDTFCTALFPKLTIIDPI